MVTSINEVEVDNSKCANCKINFPENDSPSRLCFDCKELFIKYPIPKWIYVFAGIILLLMIVSLINVPKYLSSTIHLHKTEKYLSEKKYLSASKEIKLVLEKFPSHVTANSYALIAASYNFDVLSAFDAYAKIEGTKIDDRELLTEIENAIERVEGLYPTDTALYHFILNHTFNNSNELSQSLDSVRKNNLIEPLMMMEIADAYYKFEDYKKSDSVLTQLFTEKKEFPYAFLLMASVKRKLGKYEEGLIYCDQFLNLNSEYASAIVQKAKIELTRFQDKKAEEYIKQAEAIDSLDPYVIEVKVLHLFLSGDVRSSMLELEKLKKYDDSENKILYNRTYKILHKIEKYR